MNTDARVEDADILHNTPNCGVRSMRANTVAGIKRAAAQLNQSFLHVKICGRSNLLEAIGQVAVAFCVELDKPRCADLLHALTEQPAFLSRHKDGLVVILEGLPAWGHGATEDREELLEVFRDAAEVWEQRNVSFRCFYALDASLKSFLPDQPAQAVTLAQWLTAR